MNLAPLVEQYIWRTEIPLTRDLTEKNTLTPPVLNLVGIHSPFIEESVNFNGQLTPSKTNWIKVQEAAMVLEEQPGKVNSIFLDTFQLHIFFRCAKPFVCSCKGKASASSLENPTFVELWRGGAQIVSVM